MCEISYLKIGLPSASRTREQRVFNTTLLFDALWQQTLCTWKVGCIDIIWDTNSPTGLTFVNHCY